MSNSPLDAHIAVIHGLLEEGKNNQEIVEFFATIGVITTEASVRRCIGRNDSLVAVSASRNLRREIFQRTDAPGVKYHESGEVEVTLAAVEESSVERLKIDDVRERHGLSVADWECYRALPNVWEANGGDGEKIQLHQFKVWFRKIVPLDLIVPATDPGYMPAKPRALKVGKSWLWVGFFDQHCPYFDPGLKELACRWLAHNKPERGLFGGDGPDYPDISKHAKKLAFNATPQKCVQSFFEYMRDLRVACPDTQYELLEGNHDKRIQKMMLERVYDLAALTPADWPEQLPPQEVMYSPEHLFHLARLGIELIKTPLDYEFAVARITSGLTARHGTFHGKNALQKNADKYNHDMIYGHLHRMGLHSETRWDDSTGEKKIVTVVQAPTMAEVNMNGLGYDSAPDWQQGFVTAQVFPSGHYTLEYAFYSDGVLNWRDQEYVC